MKICPSCKDEYLDYIEVCYVCDKKLLSEEEAKVAPPNADRLLSKEELLKEVTVPLVEGGLSQCRELERILEKSRISSAVYPVNLGCNDGSAVVGTTSCSMKYVLLVKESDVGACKEALEGQFHAQVAKEGKGQVVNEVIDLSQEMISCPACGESGELKEGECAFCGLFLGEH
ncbi:MAG: hypothetical protein KC505_00555 [Myxococcales bacterium]|nr:hypothetical protein [Myxococcales bacterium]USN51237.1 MAG: hypothetical protein H6731_02190 [Myxococcales bacterium]